jgi:hypothetical protein
MLFPVINALNYTFKILCFNYGYNFTGKFSLILDYLLLKFLLYYYF